MILRLNKQHYDYIGNIGGRLYWRKNYALLHQLNIPKTKVSFCGRLIEVALPAWARDLGVYKNNIILVDKSCILDGNEAMWQRVDWWAAAFHHLNATNERIFEKEHGPIHSYSIKLKGVDERLFDYAWTNRIFLFLRRWVAKELKENETELFGSLLPARIDLTHDVDYLKKTIPLRVKKTAFDCFNIFQQLKNLHVKNALTNLLKTIKFVIASQDYLCISDILALERKYGFTSCFHFYAGLSSSPRSFKKWLLDPSYDIKDSYIQNMVKNILANGWEVGLHQSFFSWDSSDDMLGEVKELETTTGIKIERCRQHWLRFSWHKTWQAQADAGLSLDTTLGFNNRPAFRNGSALEFTPLDNHGKIIPIRILPTVLMDSHLWDYLPCREHERIDRMKRWIDEVIFVHGEVSVIWHQRVYHKEYGWGKVYEELLAYMKKKGVVSR